MTRSSPPKLRPATPSDSADLLGWRNDPQTRANSRNTAVITVEEHAAWFARALADPNRRIWIAERAGRKLGTVSAVRVDGDRVEISITVALEQRGQGAGAEMIRAALHDASQVWPAGVIEAVVREDNMASRRVFERCGFVSVDRDGDFLIYRFPS